jgi:PEGA domain
VGLFLASTCSAGVDSTPLNPRQAAQDILSTNNLRSVTILSKPVGARILINGDYVGTTPMLVDFAVDKLGRAVRNIEMRALAPQPSVAQGVRLFPAAGTDGDASRIPQLVDFDLNIQQVYVIR